MNDAMNKYKIVNFEKAIELNKTKPVGYYFEKDNGDFDETWFPVRFLWEKKLAKVPLMNYTLADLKHGVWFMDRQLADES